jgi:hypothetical protein
LRRDSAAGNVVAVQLGLDLPLDLAGRHATIAALGKVCLTGYQRAWPPGPPQQDRGVYYSGFPGTETIWLSPREISFGAAPGGGVASSVSETDVSTLIERENLIAVLGGGTPPENFDFGGMSGGPMLTVIETGVIRSWSLAGVIYEGPNPAPDEAQAIAGLEIIRARRAHFILPTVNSTCSAGTSSRRRAPPQEGQLHDRQVVNARRSAQGMELRLGRGS